MTDHEKLKEVVKLIERDLRVRNIVADSVHARGDLVREEQYREAIMALDQLLWEIKDRGLIPE